MKYVLICGGAGYIGSHVNKLLNDKGYRTVIFDNLVYGHREAVKWGDFVYGDLSDVKSIERVFCQYETEAVLHFAAYAYVGESVDNPEKYYYNNVCNTLNLLQVMRRHECKKIVFSSTCATYGEQKSNPITEDMPQNPINPYGKTKLMVENILKDYEKAYGIRSVVLRYFNAAGADLDGEIGESHSPETHLIPLALYCALGIRDDIHVFGTDYPTKDGSCIRDYIHVNDLAKAHFLALLHLEKERGSAFLNLGSSVGVSVLEVIESVRKITGRNIKTIFDDRRPGDPAILIGGSDKAKEMLGWTPVCSDIDTIVESAWSWHQNARY